MSVQELGRGLGVGGHLSLRAKVVGAEGPSRSFLSSLCVTFRLPMVERASDPRREWNVHLIIVIIIIRVVMWLAPPNKMRPLSREFSLFRRN